MDEFSRLQSADLRYHHGQKSVGCDVERHSEEGIGTALVELAGEFSVCDIELEKAMAGRQGHVVHFARIPRGDYHSAGIGIVLYHVYDL